MLALLVALTIVWALRHPMTRSVGAYLLAQLAGLIGIEASWRFIGPGRIYGAVYVALTALVFATIGWIVWECLRTARYRARCVAVGMLLAAAFARLAFLGLGRQAEWFDWIAIVEGALLIWSGVLAGMSAPYTRLPDVMAGLSVLWLAQALIAFGYVLHWPLWVSVDVYARAVVAIAGFLFIGWRLQQRGIRSASIRPRRVAADPSQPAPRAARPEH